MCWGAPHLAVFQALGQPGGGGGDGAVAAGGPPWPHIKAPSPYPATSKSFLVAPQGLLSPGAGLGTKLGKLSPGTNGCPFPPDFCLSPSPGQVPWDWGTPEPWKEMARYQGWTMVETGPTDWASSFLCGCLLGHPLSSPDTPSPFCLGPETSFLASGR